MNNTRADIMALFNGKRLSSSPIFSGLIAVTIEALKREGMRLPEVHHGAGNMAKASASTFRLTGMPSATLPFDLGVEAEALGAVLNFSHEDRFPLPAAPPAASVKEIVVPPDALTRGRLPVVREGIARLKQEIGNEVVISGMIPGPYTLLLLLVEPGSLFREMKKEALAVSQALEQLADLLVQVGRAYKDAGADFITIHDMGGSPGFIGPARYEQFVFPAERRLIAGLPRPRVLSVCGNVTGSLQLLDQTGAEAVSLDQTVDLKAARDVLKRTLLFGNIDPAATLWQGEEAQITEAVRGAREAGVDAIWPGCDLVPMTPIGNIQAMMGVF
ncbi:MAG TPA: uroporphyrinogen decarboxylase family protein [Anaerolineales bacterium]|nr:uroporphyrinogen decarboxylase family protein [Anaerolineales bacterium]